LIPIRLGNDGQEEKMFKPMNFAFSRLLTVLMLWFFASNSNNVVLASESDKQPLKIGFITVESVSDWGWNYAHNQGRLYMQQALKGQVVTSVVENVPESAEVERVMEKLIAQGNKMIFATSYGYLEPALRVAKRHPDIFIYYVGRPSPNFVKNLAAYVNNPYQPMYIAGVVAGRMTKCNKIGYVASHPVPPLLINLNAFTLGARSVNPKAEVHVVWTNSWADPATEAEAARGLIDQGVDVLAAHLDSALTVVQIAEKNHLYSVGYHADIHHLAPQGWLTGQRWNWGPHYVNIVQSVLNHTWRGGNDLATSQENCSELSSIGNEIPAAVKREALDLWAKIKAGKFIIFRGPLKDRDGKIVIPAGKTLDDALLSKTDWLVPGVYGNLSKNH
jgi:basic membrane protein A and related proteins